MDQVTACIVLLHKAISGAVGAKGAGAPKGSGWPSLSSMQSKKSMLCILGNTRYLEVG
jgi:hypothetical protein